MGVVTKRSTMTLFTDSQSHYCHRVRIVLAEKGVTADMVHVEPGTSLDELADLNPYNETPTLLDRELVLYDSQVMMEYLDERFPHPPLLPVYPVARAESRQYMFRIQRDWCELADKILTGTEKQAEKARKELRDSLVGVAPIFAEKPFFMSEEFTLVDCCLIPILWRLPMLGIDLPKTKQVKPLQEYMERMFTRDSFQASLTELELEMRSPEAA